MAGRSLAASSKRFVCASSTMKTVGSLASIASDIAIILCIVGLCNLIGSNPCPTSSHRSLAVKNGVDWEKLVGTLRAHTHKTTQNTPPSHSQCACGAISTSISTAAAIVQFVDSAVTAAATATGDRAERRVWWPVGRSGRCGDANSCP